MPGREKLGYGIIIGGMGVSILCGSQIGDNYIESLRIAADTGMVDAAEASVKATISYSLGFLGGLGLMGVGSYIERS